MTQEESPGIVRCSPLFQKQAAQLEKSGGKGALAVRQAEQIIEGLRSCVGLTPFLKTKQTKHGEKRFRDIEKYDLGAGYRLVCRRLGHRIVVEFIGSHDKSCLWLNHQRVGGAGYPDENEGQTSAGQPSSPADSSRGSASAAITEKTDDPYEERLLSLLDDRLLRQIFGSFAAPPSSRND